MILRAIPCSARLAIALPTSGLGGSLKRITPSKMRSRSSREASARLGTLGVDAVEAASVEALAVEAFSVVGGRADSSSGRSTREPTATSRKPSADEPLTSLASRSCSTLWIGRAVWSSRTLPEAATIASGAPFVTSSGGSSPR